MASGSGSASTSGTRSTHPSNIIDAKDYVKGSVRFAGKTKQTKSNNIIVQTEKPIPAIMSPEIEMPFGTMDKYGSLTFSLSGHDDQGSDGEAFYNALVDIEKTAFAHAENHLFDWFRKGVKDFDFVEGVQQRDLSYPPSIRIKPGFKGSTGVFKVGEDGKYEKGEFPGEKEDGSRRPYVVKIVVRPNYIYFMAPKVGLTWEVINVLLVREAGGDSEEASAEPVCMF